MTKRQKQAEARAVAKMKRLLLGKVRATIFDRTHLIRVLFDAGFDRRRFTRNVAAQELTVEKLAARWRRAHKVKKGFRPLKRSPDKKWRYRLPIHVIVYQ